jgi:ABC-type Zn uptake system ZnuABC Zn-binding protein ZnuA
MTMRPARAMVAVLLLAACGTRGADQNVPDLHVVTTVAPITNIVHNIGGDLVRVTGLVPEGVNSHTFEPSPRDARALTDADVVFVNGLNLELPSIELARANIPEGTEIVELAEATLGPDDYIFDFSFPAEEGDPNPHLWTNPLHVARYAQIVGDVLERLDPANELSYIANASAYIARMEQLDRALRAATRTVPEGNRVLLTYHDSFPYMAREYGWTVIGAIQPSDFSDPSAREVARLIEQIRAREVPAIFGSEVFPSPVAAQIARESGARYIDELRDDDLPGSSGEPDHSLLGLLVFDFRTIVGALGGDAALFDDIDVSNLHDGRYVTYRE